LRGTIGDPLRSILPGDTGLFCRIVLLTPLGLDAIFWTVAGVGVDIVVAIAKMVAGRGGNIGIGRLPAWYFPAAVAGFLILTLLRTRVRHLGTAVMAILTLAIALGPAEAPPNLVISEDGSLVAIVHGAALASNRERPPHFIFDQWQRALVLPEHQPPRFIDAVDVSQPEKGSRRLVLSSEQQRYARHAMKCDAR
jgi:hypothetical protein